MELNKPLSVHMTHQEYDDYKKYVRLINKPHGLLICMGYGWYTGINVFNETELISELNEHIKALQIKITEQKEEILALQSAPRRKGWLW